MSPNKLFINIEIYSASTPFFPGRTGSGYSVFLNRFWYVLKQNGKYMNPELKYFGIINNFDVFKIVIYNKNIPTLEFFARQKKTWAEESGHCLKQPLTPIQITIIRSSPTHLFVMTNRWVGDWPLVVVHVWDALSLKQQISPIFLLLAVQILKYCLSFKRMSIL